MTAALRLQHVSKSFGSVAALRDISLDVEVGEYITILGPSASGKSAMLRVIAGFDTVDSGRIEVAEVLEDRLSLLKAEVDATPKADRIPLYSQAVDSLKQYEEVAKGRFEHGRGTEYALLRVRAKRLEVEVLLEQAKVAK